MFLIVHASVGAVIGEQIQSPVAAFGAGFLSHFVFDIIPHGDEIIGRTMLKYGRLKFLVALAAIDIGASFILIVIFWASGLLPNVAGAVSGALGAVLPDILAGISTVSKGRLWPGFVRFHNWNHELLGSPTSPLIGAGLQAITLLFVLLLLQSAPIVGVLAQKGS